MDDLLQQLRHDMVELSSQGDSFTHQIWLMYGQFEQVVDRFGNIGFRTECQLTPSSSGAMTSTRMAPTTNHQQQQQQQQQHVHQYLNLPSVDPFTSDDECDDSDDLADSLRYRSGPRMNPLLETISTIEDLCDSGDEGHTTCPMDLDKDSIGYAGSNSIDSGYKSSCPTPDYSSDGYYHHSAVKGTSSALPPVQQHVNAPLLKPRRLIQKPEAAKLHQRTGPAASPQESSSAGPGLDLAHLTSLRQTLLKAIERYESRVETPVKEIDAELRRSRSRSPEVFRATWSPSGPRPRSSSASSRYQHQEGAGGVPGGVPVRPGSPMAQCLKERRSLSPRPGLSRSYRLGKEASHDRLRALTAARPRLDLPRLQGTPAAAPAALSLERTPAGSAPRGIVASGAPVPQHSGGVIRVADLPMREDEIDTLLYGHSADLSPDKPAITSDVEEKTTTPSDGGTRFSRVARCMLDIIEDLQRQHRGQQQQQQQQHHQPPKAAEQQPQRAINRVPCVPPKPARQAAVAARTPATPPRVARHPRRKLPTPQPSESGDSLCGADYHLYEEIVYDLGTECSDRCSSGDVPPPLPARPWQRRNQTLKPMKPVKPVKPLRWDVPLKLVTSQQRPINLYTLTSSQQQQQQQQKSMRRTAPVQCNAHDDEYGFRSVPHMV